ncbi:hypothetical protein NA56DRAFT_172083 [Hyaloscypha hepaticicola]|uniref:Zn(2)-C6 fungal-type domain-containing protein n=1 Tax=Hyaloscypha hepaticicola TaxID=2082293 RepID=A0A2J6Q343_9HELO|nr:hypothetical protein NA56DRAFT_172083 [Hyaloscypha hepaticicola]
MKRSSSLVPGHERSPFQQPVSCQSCRTRKLKCNRGRPCFNCSSRDFDCVYLSDQRQPSRLPVQTAGPGINVSHSCERDCSALRERVRRLKAAVFGADEAEVVQKISTSARSIH